MKTTILILFLSFCLIGLLPAQNDSVISKVYRSWVVPNQHGHTVDGLLYEVKDSSVVIGLSVNLHDYQSGKIRSAEVMASDIKRIDIRRKGVHGMAALIGTGIGALIGVIVGLAVAEPANNNHLNNDYNSGMMIFMPILGAGIGAGIGGTIGSVKIHFPLHGSRSEFEIQKRNLEKYAIRNNRFSSGLPVARIERLADSVKDIDGNYYHLLAYGDQIWMAGNLRTTRFADGTAIMGKMNGRFENELWYNWETVSDLHRICPDGWHVPSQTEWSSLCSSLGGEAGATAAMDGTFTQWGWTVKWWTSTETDSMNSSSILFNAQEKVFLIYTQPKTGYKSVRCLRDK